MKIIVGFSRAKSPYALGSKAIQLAEKRPFSHAYVCYVNPITGIMLVTQASHGMVNMMNYNVFLENNIVVKEFTYDVSPERYKAFLTFLHKNLGKSYSKFQLVLIAFKILTHIEIKYHNNDNEFICSEWAARILEVLGIVNTSDEDYITPSNLEKLINK